MKEFEKQENINFEQNIRGEKLREFLMAEEVKSSSRPIEEIREKSICPDCLDRENTKVELECNHTLCKKCVMDYVLQKFENKEPYKYTIFCNMWKKNSKVVAILIGKDSNHRWTDIGKLIENKFNQNNCIISYVKCNPKDQINSFDSYLINDYAWFDFERSYVKK